MSVFQTANEIAVLFAGRRLAPLGGVGSTTNSARPQTAGAGFPLNRAILATVQVRPAPGDSGAFQVWLQAPADGMDSQFERWAMVRGGEFSFNEDGLIERINVAGYDRIYIRWSQPTTTPSGVYVKVGVPE
jgi:hypothetical protein